MFLLFALFTSYTSVKLTNSTLVCVLDCRDVCFYFLVTDFIDISGIRVFICLCSCMFVYMSVSPLFVCVCVCVWYQVPWNPDVDLCWHTLVRGESDECEPEWCESEDPLFILYTSGSTGKPKVEHTNTHTQELVVCFLSFFSLFSVNLLNSQMFIVYQTWCSHDKSVVSSVGYQMS